jgi:hypothetical protein
MPNDAPHALIPSSSPRGRNTPSASDAGSSASDAGSSAHDAGYFAQYGFKQNPDLTFIANFERFAITQGWSKMEKKSRRPEAFEAEFDLYVGTDVTKLEGWQRMCKNCLIEPAPPSIKQCKKVCSCQGCILDACLSNYRLLRRFTSTFMTTWIIIVTQSSSVYIYFPVSRRFATIAFLTLYILFAVQRKIRSSRRCFVLSSSSAAG